MGSRSSKSCPPHQPCPGPPVFPAHGSSGGVEPAPVLVYNSRANDPQFQSMIAVPAANTNFDPMWMADERGPVGPGQIVIPRGSFALLPAEPSQAYNLWLLLGPGQDGSTGSHNARGLQSSLGLAATSDLRTSLNDQNQQTALNGSSGNGAVFFRTFSTTGQEVFVFGAINDLTGSGDGVGVRGLYVDPTLNLTWTNVHNRPDFGLVQTSPPGFYLQSAQGSGSDSGSGSGINSAF
jgi:hypothetical protein